jgi:MtrB/PioB family decaheme-associated outer membrane protein
MRADRIKRMRMAVIFMLIMSLIWAVEAFSEEQEKSLSGEVAITGEYIGVKGEGAGQAKFTEYRDLRQGGEVFGRARLKLDTDKYFMNFDGADFGYRTQYYRMDGGMWGKFKVDLFYDEIPHNITFNALTPFLGAGRDTLIGVQNPFFPAWNNFDYSTLRHQYGGGVKLDMLKPFFANISFQREERDGIRPIGASQTTPGGIAFELPQPIHYMTNDLKGEFGYSLKPVFASLNLIYSDFNNRDTQLNLPAGAGFTAPNVISLPPDNKLYKGSFKGALQLPFNTRFSTNIGVSRGKSETSVVSLIGSDFQGRVKNTNLDLALTSNPVRFIDVKLYYKYYKRNNESYDSRNVIQDFTDYKINTYGSELGVRLPAKFYLSGGFKYVKTGRDNSGEAGEPEEILPSNIDRIYFSNLKWSGLDFMDFRMGFEKMDRDAIYHTIQSETRPDQKYYFASQGKSTIKTAIDVYPIENLNFGLEYRFKKTDYKNTIFGLQGTKQNEIDISADYTFSKRVKVYGYTDIGLIDFDQVQARTNRPIDVKTKDRTFGYGLGTEFYVIPQKLTFILQHDYIKSNGSVDLTYFDPTLFADAGVAGANNRIIDIMRWDDYTRYSFRFRGVYNFTKSISFSAGYGFERYNFKDAQTDGYIYVPAAAGSNGAYLTGAYKDPTYKAHMIFTTLSYRF